MNVHRVTVHPAVTRVVNVKTPHAKAPGIFDNRHQPGRKFGPAPKPRPKVREFQSAPVSMHPAKRLRAYLAVPAINRQPSGMTGPQQKRAKKKARVL
jgi:hypothetical protein